jgi:hypothetical protein
MNVYMPEMFFHKTYRGFLHAGCQLRAGSVMQPGKLYREKSQEMVSGIHFILTWRVSLSASVSFTRVSGYVQW